MDKEVRRQIGKQESLEISLTLFSDADHPQSMLWGRMLVSLDGDPIWSSETEQGHDAPVSWAWIDLLEFLGDKWPWLILEEQYPIPITPLHPGTMRREAEKRWESMGEEQYLDEDERLFLFEARHDLSLGLKGVFLPSLFIFRQGEKAWICSQDSCLFVSFSEIRKSLTELGNYLAEYAGGTDNSRAEQAVQRWKQREERVCEFFWELRAGMADELRKKLEQGTAPEEFWEAKDIHGDYDNVLLAAVRLSAGVASLKEQQSILQHLKQSPFRETCALDETSDRLLSELDESMRPYEQGYTLAQLLRGELGLDDDSQADPEDVLRSWGIDIQELALDFCPVDAVAAWGRSHGPIIMLNSGHGGRPAHMHGRRSTLAHEICHLLADRQGALPFSEVFGGHTPLYVEQRANAFAAEFLLPRESAIQRVRCCHSLQEALEALCEHFAVSTEMAALQLKNSRLLFELNEEERGVLVRSTLTGMNNDVVL